MKMRCPSLEAVGRVEHRAGLREYPAHVIPLWAGSGQRSRGQAALGGGHTPTHSLSVTFLQHLWGVSSVSFMPGMFVVCEVKESGGGPAGDGGAMF